METKHNGAKWRRTLHADPVAVLEEFWFEHKPSRKDRDGFDLRSSCVCELVDLLLSSREQSYMESVVTFLQDVVPQVNVFTFYSLSG